MSDTPASRDRAPIFIQGVRRSGTTFLFDVLGMDARLSGYYEPLGLSIRPSLGGGSGIRGEDYFEKVRDVRAAFLGTGDASALRSLNEGGPDRPEVEFEPDFRPQTVRYLRYVLEREPNQALLKFVRAACKARALARLAPGAFFLHIVRDPRAVVTSFLLGKQQRHRGRFQRGEDLFAQDHVASGRRQFAQGLLQHLPNAKEFSGFERFPDYMQLLALWAYSFARTHRDAARAFKARYVLLRHEDLLADANATMSRLYEDLGLEAMPDEVRRWLEAHVQRAPICWSPHNRHWFQAFDRLKIRGVLEAAGYENLDDAPMKDVLDN